MRINFDSHFLYMYISSIYILNIHYIMEELIKLTKENNRLLKKIIRKLDDMSSQDNIAQNTAISFGIGILSNIVGDRLLGLGKNNT